MPSFAELRAKAEAAASSAKESANSKIADYRGDKKPEKPVYKVPPRRPAVKPPLPPETSRPGVAGYDLEESVPEELEEEEPVRVKESKPVGPAARAGRASLASMVVQRVDQGKGIEVLLDNKELFFQFLDEFFAAKGYDVNSRLPASQDQEEEAMEEQEELEPEEDEVPEGDDPSTPTETPYRHQEVFAEPSPSPPPRPPTRKPPPPKPRISSDEPEEPVPSSPAPRRLPPPIAHKPIERNPDFEPTPDAVVSPGRIPAKPSSAVQALFSNLQARPGPMAVPLPLPDVTSLSTSTSTSIGRGPAPPIRPVRHSIPRTPEELHEEDEDLTPPPPPPQVKPSTLGLGSTSRLSKLLHTSSSRSGSPGPSPTVLDSSVGPSPPPVPPLSTRPPPVNRASRPGAAATPSGATPPQPSSTPASLSNVGMHSITGGGNTNTSIGTPPSMFFTGDTNEEWIPPLPYGYMPSAGREVTEGQCSAAQLCSYFAAGVPWDTWYAVGDSSARPASIIDRVEARWKGSVMYSQETKKRLFGAGKTKNERSLTGVVTFQDLSIAWYRVTYREEDPIKSLRREARYRAAPSSWNGEKLYAAHLLYGQAITDFCERTIRMRQRVGGGEAWDLANGALTCLAKYVPNAPPVIPSIGHCHGHLIYEGYVDEGSGRIWGATRGGETAIRNGDIIEWCDAQVQIQDENEEITIFSFGSGYTSVILSAVEFPERLDEDAQTLPPTHLPDLEIVMQSAASGLVPTRKLALLSTLVKGRIWIYRPVGWEYVGLSVEPDPEWPPPDPTLFLPS